MAHQVPRPHSSRLRPFAGHPIVVVPLSVVDWSEPLP